MGRPKFTISPWFNCSPFLIFFSVFLFLTSNFTTFFSVNYFAPQSAFAAEDDEPGGEGDEEFETEDEDDFESEEDEELDEEDGETDEEGNTPEEDPNAHLYDIGPAKDQKFEQYTFPWLGNRKAAWWGAQLHILFASFILIKPVSTKTHLSLPFIAL